MCCQLSSRIKVSTQGCKSAGTAFWTISCDQMQMHIFPAKTTTRFDTLCVFFVRTEVTIRSMYVARISVLSLHVGIPCFNVICPVLVKSFFQAWHFKRFAEAASISNSVSCDHVQSFSTHFPAWYRVRCEVPSKTMRLEPHASTRASRWRRSTSPGCR